MAREWELFDGLWGKVSPPERGRYLLSSLQSKDKKARFQDNDKQLNKAKQ